MKNPDSLTAHEKRVDQHIERLATKILSIEDLPATPHNRLLLLRTKFELQIWLNSWYKLDKGQETPEGKQIVREEAHIRLYWEKCYRHTNQLLSSWHRFEGKKLDLSGIEQWLEPQQRELYA